ncbi:MAG: menaquinone biosynthesis protein [Bacteroidales bacterium]
MHKIRISAVRYANTYPFIYGLTESRFDSRAVIETDHPSECAAKLISGRADLGLVPVAAIPLIERYHIIGDYCIGADGKVRTVQLMSDSRPETVQRVFLDYRSRTSVNLIRVIARNFWKREPEWINTFEGFDFKSVGINDAVVLIGDQCFELENRYSYSIDLAEEWKNFTGLPFVFACWIANKELPADFISGFNDALALGVNNIDKVAERFENAGTITGKVLKDYLKNNIDYNFDERKRKALDLFLGYLRKL